MEVKSDWQESSSGGLEKWRLIPAFLSTRSLAQQHIQSFNYFISHDIKNIILANKTILSDVDPKFKAEYLDVYVRSPSYQDLSSTKPLTPHLCRIRDMTYSAPVFVDVQYTRGEGLVKKKGVLIGYIPVMLRSDLCVLSTTQGIGVNQGVLQGAAASESFDMQECPLDPGGYFIIRGTERVLLMQEQINNNRIILEWDSKKQVQAVCTSNTADNKSRTVVCSKIQGREGLFVKHSAFTDLVGIVTVLKGLGVESDQEIFDLVVGSGEEDAVQDSLVNGVLLSLQDAHALHIYSQLDALKYLADKLRLRATVSAAKVGSNGAVFDTRHAEVLDALKRQVLSHVKGELVDKARYLCLMARRVLEIRGGKGKLDDRDYYGNKRVEMAGQLISLLFEDQFKNFNNEIKLVLDKQLTKFSGTSGRGAVYPDAFQSVPWERVTQAMNKAISTGNINIKRFRIDLTGCSQVLSRLSYIGALGAMTRIKSQFDAGMKIAGPRFLQPSQWGVICPSDTPEGEQCGLVKHLTLLAHVTTPEDDSGVVRLCFGLGTEDAALLSGEQLHSLCKVYVNGVLIGVHSRPKKLVQAVRGLRRAGLLGEFVSIYIDEERQGVFVSTDGGRLCRPLIIVDKGESKLKPDHMEMIKAGELKFADLLKLGVVEWLDVNEENDCFIALDDPKITDAHTHVEIDPISLLGTVTGLIPYPHHNQSPRNTYQCAMGKQAMGTVAWNQYIRTDTLLLTLVYPQKPLCKSRTLEYIGWENLPAGHNSSVAVMSYSGYDIEDAIVMNKASLDRGFGRCGYTRRYEATLAKVDGWREELRPPPVASGTVGSSATLKGASGSGALRKYQWIDEDGVPRVGDVVTDGALIVNKVTPIAASLSSAPSSFVESGVRYKNPTEAYVERVIFTEDAEQTVNVKLMMRQIRRPELGDKFSSRHGQKGVVGLIVPQEDMAFNPDSGWCPDLIMNPHGFPSRMTVGKMLECIGGKGGVLCGKQAYGTVFGGTTRDEISEQLIMNGFHPSGKDTLVSGITGEYLQCYVFQGPIYYQKLRHMVHDKMHGRATGPRQGLTRQPTEGRSKDGGLRLGEMERDCLVAYGGSNLLLERLLLSSDVFYAPVCSRCGLIVQKGWCGACRSAEDVVSIRMPYACKLLFQEMQAMNVVAKMNIKHR